VKHDIACPIRKPEWPSPQRGVEMGGSTFNRDIREFLSRAWRRATAMFQTVQQDVVWYIAFQVSHSRARIIVDVVKV
jgi:hypothetical protein